MKFKCENVSKPHGPLPTENKPFSHIAQVRLLCFQKAGNIGPLCGRGLYPERGEWWWEQIISSTVKVKHYPCSHLLSLLWKRRASLALSTVPLVQNFSCDWY